MNCNKSMLCIHRYWCCSQQHFSTVNKKLSLFLCHVGDHDMNILHHSYIVQIKQAKTKINLYIYRLIFVCLFYLHHIAMMKYVSSYHDHQHDTGTGLFSFISYVNLIRKFGSRDTTWCGSSICSLMSFIPIPNSFERTLHIILSWDSWKHRNKYRTFIKSYKISYKIVPVFDILWHLRSTCHFLWGYLWVNY